jgi:hypothetical protein
MVACIDGLSTDSFLLSLKTATASTPARQTVSEQSPTTRFPATGKLDKFVADSNRN